MIKLRAVGGTPVPFVHQFLEGTPIGDWQWEWHPRWEVVFPDEPHWHCCERTDEESFGTWQAALRYALDRRWEPR